MQIKEKNKWHFLFSTTIPLIAGIQEGTLIINDLH